MSKWSNLLLDVNYMKQSVSKKAREIKIDVAKTNVIDKSKLMDAKVTRFLLDVLLLEDEELFQKHAQYKVYDVNSFNIIKFEGSKKECEDYVSENDFLGTYIVLRVLPTDVDFNWEMYFEKCFKNQKSDNFPSIKNIQ